ncbi:MAG: hypothetical protein Q9165_004609 [Trypethelium subeluteriae]
MSSELDDDSSRIRSLLKQQQTLTSKCPEILRDDNARAELLELSRELTAQLTQPDELVADLAHAVSLPAVLSPQRTFRLNSTLFAKRTDLDNHNYWAKQAPDTMADLQSFMDGLYGGPLRSHWLSWFPMSDILTGLIEDEVAFVDIAGGRGHEGQAVLQKTDCKGRFVLQDLPEVINSIRDLDLRIETMGHDFLRTQPVKGAKVYFLSNILHDHPDPICKIILRRIAEVMKPGYSKLLISNIIMKDDQPPSRQLDMDITMLVLSGGLQRTEEDWTKLLGSVGLRIIKFWLSPGDQNGIVEAELKEDTKLG